MMTPWGEGVTAENAWRDYPRPQMVRGNWENLNGLWDWAITPATNTAAIPTAWEGKILVPFALEAPLSGVGRKLERDEFLWYRRTFRVEMKNEELRMKNEGEISSQSREVAETQSVLLSPLGVLESRSSLSTNQHKSAQIPDSGEMICEDKCRFVGNNLPNSKTPSGESNLCDEDKSQISNLKSQISPASFGRLLLNFEAVDWRAQVFVNGREAGLHESPNEPFSLDITDLVREGENELVVCVWDPSDNGSYGSCGKQTTVPTSSYFYTRSSGIVGTVWLERVPPSYIRDYDVTPDVSAGEVAFEFEVNGLPDVFIAESRSGRGAEFSRQDSDAGFGRVERVETDRESSGSTCSIRLKTATPNPVNPVRNGARGRAPSRASATLRLCDEDKSQISNLKSQISTDAPVCLRLGSLEILDGSNVVARTAFAPGRPVRVAMPEGYRLWTPDAPHLYTFRARWGADEVEGYFAMRSAAKVVDEEGHARFALNGQPLFLAATLDQGWWPDGLLTPPSAEAAAADIRALKAFGYNALRKHIKVESRVYYALCDRLGMMVIQDMPSDHPKFKATADQDRYAFFRRDLKRVVAHLKKVPSIVMWVVYNEGWGQPGALLTRAAVEAVQRQDPTRPVDGVSGWNDYGDGDVQDVHDYSESLEVLAQKAAEDSSIFRFFDSAMFSRVERVETCSSSSSSTRSTRLNPTRLNPTNAPIQSNNRKIDESKNPGASPRLLLLGECGGLAQGVEGHQWNPARKVGYRFFDDGAAMQEAYLALMARLGALKRAGLAGFVYTQTTDVEIELNGLMTYDRRVLKFDPAALRRAHEALTREEEP